MDHTTMNHDHVQFKCMVQDIIGNEVFGNDESKLSERTAFYCITIPGENEWVNNNSQDVSQFMSANGSPQVTCLAHQRLYFNLVSSSFPIPSKNNRSCIVLVYDEQTINKLKVNDIILVEGTLEPSNPSDGEPPPEPQGEFTGRGGPNASLMTFEPLTDFPSKLVPRVTATKITRLSHINPLMSNGEPHKIDKTNIQLVRARLSTILTQLFGGDSLASEYLILSLISGVYRRKDVTTLGQLTIGIIGVKAEMEFLIKKIYDIIRRITTHSHYLEMTISNLNNLTFTPRKDHENNKLLSGTMQLPSGSYVVINETALSEGRLNTHGTQNIAALSDIIRWQRHSYDFQFHRLEFDTDIKILVMSEGKSVLPVECSVMLANTNSDNIEQMRQACASVDDFMTDDLLNKLRCYITSTKELTDYEIPENLQKTIEIDFVEWRKKENQTHTFTAEDLSFYLTLARYLTLSRGETVLTREIWEEVCEMERQRLARLNNK